jgi:hypothetical protein
MSFINALRLKHKNDNFINWLNKNIEPDKTNKDVVYEMIGEIKIMLTDYGYKIENKKQFKNELATYIYNDST